MYFSEQISVNLFSASENRFYLYSFLLKCLWNGILQNYFNLFYFMKSNTYQSKASNLVREKAFIYNNKIIYFFRIGRLTCTEGDIKNVSLFIILKFYFWLGDHNIFPFLILWVGYIVIIKLPLLLTSTAKYGTGEGASMFGLTLYRSILP